MSCLSLYNFSLHNQTSISQIQIEATPAKSFTVGQAKRLMRFV